MNDTEESGDRNVEHGSSASSECQSGNQNPVEAESEPTRFTPEDGKNGRFNV